MSAIGGVFGTDGRTASRNLKPVPVIGTGLSELKTPDSEDSVGRECRHVGNVPHIPRPIPLSASERGSGGEASDQPSWVTTVRPRGRTDEDSVLLDLVSGAPRPLKSGTPTPPSSKEMASLAQDVGQWHPRDVYVDKRLCVGMRARNRDETSLPLGSVKHAHAKPWTWHPAVTSPDDGEEKVFAFRRHILRVHRQVRHRNRRIDRPIIPSREPLF